MGATQQKPNGNNNTNTFPRRRRRGSLFSFGACFGLSSPRKNLYHDPPPSAAAAHDPGDDQSVKSGREKPGFSKSDIPTSESIKEIQTIAAESPPPHLHQVNNEIDQDIITEEKNKNKNKNKNKQEQSNIPAKVQEISSNPMMTKLRHSASLPLLARPAAPPQPRLKKEKTDTAAIGSEGGNGYERAEAAGKVDSMVGASMITLTLVVMLIWGKTCAILCSAAWVFFVHCFRQNSESFDHKNVSGHRILDLDSHEYKRKVVLQGFLERI